ncbi:MAG: hypothetical protein DDG60_05665 [Anaerolineae bacterium]|nr:MAG: hypothetical protein DDG60_05665 [Anaerolineae bacterium]
MKQEFLEKLPAPLRTILVAFFNWWDDLVAQSVMSLVWSIALLTAILAPPLTFGIYYVQGQYVRGENPGLRGMLEGARRYFFKSWQWMLANLLLVGVFYASFQAYGLLGGWLADLGRMFSLFIAIFWLTMQFYTIPFVMIQAHPSLRLAWRNSFFLVMASPFYLLALFLFLFLYGLISLLLVFPVILGWISMVSILGTQAVKDRLETFGITEAKS